MSSRRHRRSLIEGLELRQLMSGTFSAPISSPAPLFNGNASTLLASDYNHDGKVDVVAASDQSIQGMTGAGDGTFNIDLNNFSSSLGTIRTAVMGDLNHDGIPDVVVTDGTTIQVALGTANSGFAAATPLSNPFPDITDLKLVDLNHDGSLDIVAATDGDEVQTFLNDGTGSFNSGNIVFAPVFSPDEKIAIGDFNNDGNADVAVLGDNRVGTLLGDGTGSLNFWDMEPIPFSFDSTIAAGDLNHDGNADLVIAGEFGPVMTLNGDGDGSFGPANFQNFSVNSQVTLADVNNDGSLDIVVSNPEVDIYLNDGDGNFTPDATSNTQSVFDVQSLIAADVNNDGRTDLVALDSTGQINTLLNLAGTQTTIASSQSAGNAGQSITLNASVRSTELLSATPGGTITFSEGSTSLGTATLDSSGNASLTLTSGLAAGAHDISASYGGDAKFAFSTSATDLSEVVTASDPIVTATSSANVSSFGQSITIDAKVTSPQSSFTTAPTGDVDFTAIDSGSGLHHLADVNLDSGGDASVSVDSLPPGQYTITAVYSGDTNFNTLTKNVSQQVNISSTHTSLTLTNGTLQASVSASSPGTGTPTGTVTFSDGGDTLDTLPLDNSGNASLSVALAAEVGHSLTATYNGDDDFDTSASLVLSQSVQQHNVGISLTPSSNAAVVGQPVTFSVSVTPSLSVDTAVPTGSIDIVAVGGGSTIDLGQPALDGSGNASITTSALPLGSYTVVATYQGDATYNTATSQTVPQSVSAAATHTAVSVALNGAPNGQQSVVEATVTAVAPAVGIPTGSVRFTDGSTLLGTVALNSAGKATLDVALSTTVDHNIIASYLGSPNFKGSNSDLSASTATIAPTITQHLFESILGRAPTSGETLTARATLRKPTGYEKLTASLVSSSSYYLLVGGSDAAFITAASHQLTGQAPSAKLLAHWTGTHHSASDRSNAVLAMLKTTPALAAFVRDANHTYLQQVSASTANASGLAYLAHHSRLSYLHNVLSPTEFVAAVS